MIAFSDYKAGKLEDVVTMLRVIVFCVAAFASIVAIGMIPFYEHWYSSKPAYAALASDSLHVWLNYGLTTSTIAFVGSLFGKGPQRIIAFLLAILEIYFWFVLSIAV